ncbi:MAG: peptidylprolyl isomerase [Candidatus Dadabacteria bacterium]|nr:peptidylprolyl isomerase [Candidatus Dadabacteria bacterium]
MSAKIEMGDTVTFNYEGKVEDGSTFHTLDEEPLAVELGTGALVKGLEEGLVGMAAGEEKTFKVAPEKGYGVENPDLVQTVEKKLFADAGMNPEPGLVFKTPNGNCHITRVLEDRVEISYNHPLAGRTLDYHVKVIGVAGK